MASMYSRQKSPGYCLRLQYRFKLVLCLPPSLEDDGPNSGNFIPLLWVNGNMTGTVSKQ